MEKTLDLERIELWQYVNKSILKSINSYFFDIGFNKRELKRDLDEENIMSVKELLFDEGWIRLVEPHNKNIDNKVEGIEIIAYDVIGGFFVINNGYFDKKIGKLFYLSPDSLEWLDLNIGYREFLYWLSHGDLRLFYKNERWDDWEKDIKILPRYKVFEFNPPLWSEEGSIEISQKKIVPVDEVWELNLLYQNKLGMASPE